MRQLLRSLLVLLTMVTILTSCKKEEGEGGTSSIIGKVYVKDYNDTFTVLEDEYYGQEVDVYIIYGDDVSFGDRTRTNYDGTYEFKYLRKGTYHVYAYSKDSTLQSNALVPVIQTVEISKNSQEVQVSDLVVFD